MICSLQATFSKQVPNRCYKPRRTIPTWRVRTILGQTLISNTRYTPNIGTYIHQSILSCYMYSMYFVCVCSTAWVGQLMSISKMLFIWKERAMSQQQTTDLATARPHSRIHTSFKIISSNYDIIHIYTHA